MAGIGRTGQHASPGGVAISLVVEVPSSLLVARNPADLNIAGSIGFHSDGRGIARSLRQAGTSTSQEFHIGTPIGLAGTGGIHLGRTVRCGAIEHSMAHGSTGCLLIAEDSRTIGRAAVVDNGHHNIAGTVVSESALVEVKVVIAIGGAVKRAGVDQRQLTVGHKHGVCGRTGSDIKVGTGGVAHVYLAVGGMGHRLRIGVVKSNATEVGGTSGRNVGS